MATATSKLPDMWRGDPDLAGAIEDILKPYTGAKLEKAQSAVLATRKSSVQGQFSDIVEAYRDAVKAAVK